MGGAPALAGRVPVYAAGTAWVLSSNTKSALDPVAKIQGKRRAQPGNAVAVELFARCSAGFLSVGSQALYKNFRAISAYLLCCKEGS